VEYISDERLRELFAELQTFGVLHQDQAKRNVTYHSGMGRFCLIDFEFATILEPGYPPPPTPPEADDRIAP
jgi:Ser/Thr protein kinase RdoA (MazF antagonist)